MRAAALAAVALLAAGAYARAPFNGFATDDAGIVANPLLQEWSTLPASLASAWWWRTGRLYRPFSLVTLGAEHLAAGGAPWLSHAVNVALHAAVALLVTRLFARFLPPAAAFASGALFALLPAHAEAVASIVGRAELLAALAIVALLLLVTGEQPPTPRTRLVVAALAALALASKEGGVAAPFLALAAAWTRPQQRPHALQWAASALAGTAALLLARLIVLGTLAGDRPHPLFQAVSTSDRLALALSMLPRAAAMLVLPVAPAIDHVPTMDAARHPDPLLVVLGALLVGAAAAALAWHVRRPAAVTLAVCIVAATMAPTANLFFASGVVLAGRNLYAPSIGALLLVGAAIAAALATRASRLVPYAVATLALLSLAATWREVPVWRSSDAVFAATSERDPGNYRAPMYHAYVARDGGRREQALAQFRLAAERFPADPEMLTDGATVALALHDTASAVSWLRSAVDAQPLAARARARLAGVLRAQGDSAGATALLIEGARVDPAQRQWKALADESTR